MLKAIIIDDEKRAREVLQYNLSRHCATAVKLIGEAADLKSGVELIKTLEPDFIFLDIEMPDYLGTEIKSFFETIDFEIIFVTAYSKYALKAFELSATDYLLKPIDPERLKEAVGKVMGLKGVSRKTERIKILEGLLKSGKTEKITISYVGGFHIVELKSVILISAEGAYSKIILTDKEILVSKNLRQLEQLLSEFDYFFRAHRSFIVNLNHVKTYTYNSGKITLTNNLNAQLSPDKTKQLSEKLNEPKS